MRKSKIIVVSTILVISLVLVVSTMAAGGYLIPRSVIGGGGLQAAGGGFILNGTVGEPIASNLNVGTTFGIVPGFGGPLGIGSIYLWRRSKEIHYLIRNTG